MGEVLYHNPIFFSRLKLDFKANRILIIEWLTNQDIIEYFIHEREIGGYRGFNEAIYFRYKADAIAFKIQFG